ncbi:MAG: hypothetical protein VB018_00310 [Lachnospiraceae bacterium]|nr:hypothetical protein [Lachnospiraceae bacterium]
MKKKIWIVMLFLLALALSFSVAVSAFWNSDEAVNIKASDIENSTLAIGTHLIYLGSMTDQIYEIALDSAQESEQTNIYYKSELADGTWFDITTASSLADITTAGTPVDDKIIEELYFTHHTKSDGITYDLRTGKAVNLYDIKPPYDLETLEELMPLKNHYDLTKGTQADSKIGKKKIEQMEQIFATEVENEYTAQLDETLSALKVYYDILANNGGGAAEMAAVQKVMDAVDETRRAVVFKTLEDTLNTFAQTLQSVEDKQDEEGNVESGSGSDTNFQAAVSESLNNVSTSLIESMGKMLDEGTTITSATEYSFAKKLCDDAVAKNHSACDEDVAMLMALDNILNAVVGNKEVELDLLENTLLNKAQNKYLQMLGTGENQEYKNAKAENTAGVLLQSIADANASQINVFRSEYEFFIEAKALRVTNADAQTYIDKLLGEATGYYDKVKEDAFQAGANTTVDKHIEFLSTKKRKLVQAAGGNELDKLLVQKEKLQSEMMAALDKNDLQGAKIVENKISDIDKKIAEITTAQVNEVSDLLSELKDLEKQLEELQTKNGANGFGTDGTGAGETGTSGYGSDGTGTDGAGTNGNGTDGNEKSKEEKTLESKIALAKAKLVVAQAGMSDGTVGKIVSDIKKDCLDIIGDSNSSKEDFDKLSENCTTLGEMLNQNYQVVFPAIKEIYGEMVSERDLNDKTSFDDAIGILEEYILNNSSAYAAAISDDKTKEELQALIDAFFEGKGDSLLDASSVSSLQNTNDDITGLTDDEKQAVTLLALALYEDETNSEDAKNMMAVEAQKGMNMGNSMVFSSLTDEIGNYVPITAIGKYTGMRYLWIKNLDQATLAKGASYYAFKSYSDIVTVGKNKPVKETMTRSAKKLGELYIPSDYAYEKFGVEAKELNGSSYSVLSTDKLQGFSEELFALFLS